MERRERLADEFEANRGRLRGVAYRMLGSLSEAEDAVQEAWLRLNRTDAGAVDNLAAWLTTVVARVSLDMLRSKKSRREDALDVEAVAPAAARPAMARDPEQEMLLANSVGLALLVILETLEPAERLAFVLHDMFAVPFEEIAGIVGKSPDAARQLASRARRRVHGTPIVPDADRTKQRELVDAFLAAARGGNFEGLLAILDPDVVLRTDRAGAPGGPIEIRSAKAIAEAALKGGAKAAQPIMVNGSTGIVIAPGGRLMMVMVFTIANGRVVEIDAVADQARLAALELSVPA